jgi:His-Xaa-Ser system radical SAM maturase HxsC
LKSPRVALIDRDAPAAKSDSVTVGSELKHLNDSDVITFSSDLKRMSVLWRNKSAANTILLTERCDNYCVMCSQPPKYIDDSYLLEQAKDLITALKGVKAEFPIIGITGGEPTLYGRKFADLLSQIDRDLPDYDVHVLSNGRRFADSTFCQSIKNVVSDRLVIGIPIYGAIAEDHDEVVGSDGAFYETVLGIHNLVEMGALVEIRVVLQRALLGKLVGIADFVSRSLPGTIQVALMGLELMGFARSNFEVVWVDPLDYASELVAATRHLAANGCNPRIYNHQLCVLAPEIRRYAVSSISDWKREFDTVCSECAVATECGGFFASSTRGISRGISPLSSMTDCGTVIVDPNSRTNTTLSEVRRPSRRLTVTPIPHTS